MCRLLILLAILPLVKLEDGQSNFKQYSSTELPPPQASPNPSQETRSVGPGSGPGDYGRPGQYEPNVYRQGYSPSTDSSRPGLQDLNRPGQQDFNRPGQQDFNRPGQIDLSRPGGNLATDYSRPGYDRPEVYGRQDIYGRPSSRYPVSNVNWQNDYRQTGEVNEDLLAEGDREIDGSTTPEPTSPEDDEHSLTTVHKFPPNADEATTVLPTRNQTSATPSSVVTKKHSTPSFLGWISKRLKARNQIKAEATAVTGLTALTNLTSTIEIMKNLTRKGLHSFAPDDGRNGGSTISVRFDSALFALIILLSVLSSASLSIIGKPLV